jgi:hypothetical protein
MGSSRNLLPEKLPNCLCNYVVENILLLNSQNSKFLNGFLMQVNETVIEGKYLMSSN